MIAVNTFLVWLKASLVWLKASLRPTRLVNACLRTMPKLLAAITGGTHRIAGANQGLRGRRWPEQGEKNEAYPPRTTMLAVAPIRARFQTVQSTSAPAGVRAATVAIPAIVMTMPTCVGPHPWLDQRKIARNGPTRPCTSGMRKLRQSSTAWFRMGFPRLYGSGRGRRQRGGNRPCNYRTAR